MRFATAALLSLLPLAAAHAQSLSKQDKAFFHKAAIGGMTEVTEGQAALTQATSPDVKMFAQKMVDDHTANNKALMALASSKNVTLPETLPKMAQTQADKEAKTTGSAFDTTYIKDQVKNHEMMQTAMQKEVSSGSDPDVKAFAQMTLSTVQDHLAMAKSLKTGAAQ